MESTTEILKTKRRILNRHLDFVIKMKNKFSDTKFASSWNHMYNCIVSDKKV